MDAVVPAEEAERRRDKLRLRIRKEGKVASDPRQLPTTDEKDERSSRELSVVPVTTVSHDRSCAEGDNR